MEIRRGLRLRTRRDAFGGVCYVPHRDDFFAADKGVFSLIEQLPHEWSPAIGRDMDSHTKLASLGICETRNPQLPEQSYSGPSFLGQFEEIPTVNEPLVINCFCTAHCPLRCVYCHADDLMQEFRENETDQDLDNVAATARLIPAIVAVITGGDPLTRPDRAIRLIEQLAPHKALVLDTSGAGDIDALIPALQRYRVHIRVSLDALSQTNDRVRPGNRDYGFGPSASREGAVRTITACIEAGIPVTVQTVISARTENESEWLDIRDSLLRWGVHHWVLHLAVEGGSARRIEEARRKQTRRRGILPSAKVHDRVRHLVRDTETSGMPIDIRCTDTGNTPNSVLLIGSRGDLFTEGYASRRKVRLYEANRGRPDLVRSLWPHLDRFGHARRYLNWNDWLSGNKDLPELCIPFTISEHEDSSAQLIEVEAKYHVADYRLLRQLLSGLGFSAGSEVWQRDEYYDSPERALGGLDCVIRVRHENGREQVGFKGPRSYAGSEYARIELEFEPKSKDHLYNEMRRRGLECTWFFEKRRTAFGKDDCATIVAVDEIPDMGLFVEFEGPLDELRLIAERCRPALGRQESRNYKDLFIDFHRGRGSAKAEILGAEFVEGPRSQAQLSD